MGMRDLTEGILDILLFLIIGGICLSIGFGFVFSMTRDIDEIKHFISDKSVQLENNYIDNNSYDDSLSGFEVILLTQVQDNNMPFPRKYKVYSYEQDVFPSYREDLIPFGVQVYNQLKGSDPTLLGRYEIKYSYGSTDSSSDDYYYIERK